MNRVSCSAARQTLWVLVLFALCCAQLRADDSALKGELRENLVGRVLVSKIIFGEKGHPQGYSAEYPVNTLAYPGIEGVVYRVEWGLIRGKVTYMERQFNQGTSSRVNAVDLKDDHLELKLESQGGGSAKLKLMLGAGWQSKLDLATIYAELGPVFAFDRQSRQTSAVAAAPVISTSSSFTPPDTDMLTASSNGSKQGASAAAQAPKQQVDASHPEKCCNSYGQEIEYCKAWAADTGHVNPRYEHHDAMYGGWAYCPSLIELAEDGCREEKKAQGEDYDCGPFPTEQEIQAAKQQIKEDDEKSQKQAEFINSECSALGLSILGAQGPKDTRNLAEQDSDPVCVERKRTQEELDREKDAERAKQEAERAATLRLASRLGLWGCTENGQDVLNRVAKGAREACWILGPYRILTFKTTPLNAEIAELSARFGRPQPGLYRLLGNEPVESWTLWVTRDNMKVATSRQHVGTTRDGQEVFSTEVYYDADGSK